MKKYLLPFFALLLFNQLNAQKEFWFELGAKGSVGLSFLTNKNIIDDDKYTYKLTMMNSFGGKFAANFGHTHSIVVEGMFANLGQDFDYRLVSGGPEATDEIDFKSLNLGLLYRVNMQRNFIELGPVYSKVNSVKHTSESDATKFYEDNYLSGVLGFGAYLTGAETFSLGMGLRFHYTFADLVNDNGQKTGYPTPSRVPPYPDEATSHFAYAELMLEFNFGVGHFAKTSCSDRFRKMRRR
ncbi:MAG: hypothetical protein K9J37_07360 [Saprospiraceae bacterium]|nr:hypothetical protein [Saprospiraceae bacterium]MCF8249715.1 hypothetical protein [Saprospiraceae bacterium]MCF8282501.1 hypothetical protein [Bacteroidales bacterium]MCF8314086.1 hypothetical protein [Saprospiraceae bacterium]MCF8442831.1 hypothetical protein [Saprospiraceae bacterium]